MRILVVTNMYPDEARPVYGAFVRSQVEALRAAGVPAEVLFIDGQASTWNYARGIARVRRAATGPFDLLHAHYGLTGFLAVQQRLRPVVITFHGDDLLGTPRADGSLTAKSRVARRLGRWAAHRAAANIVVSRQMLAHLPRGRARDRGVVVPMGVNLEKFRPMDREAACRALGLPPDRRRLLFAADPTIPVKRHWLAAAAAEIVRHRHPEADLHVVQGQPPDSIPLHMNASDVLLVTSLHEGGPMVVKEALACDLPVVAVPVGDIAERLRGIEGCHLVPPDPQAIAAAVERVLIGGRRVRGRPAVVSMSVEAVAERLRELYAQVAEAR